MPEQKYTSFDVLRHEPILRAITPVRFSPLVLFMLFLLMVSLPFTASVLLFEAGHRDADYLSFFDNLSWPISILFLFPIIFATATKLYRKLPALLSSLAGLVDNEPAAEKAYDDHVRAFENKSNNRFLAYFLLSATCTFNIAITYQVLNQGFTGWMTSGVYFSFLSEQGSGLTGVGVFAVIIQTALLYWVMSFFWKSLALTWFLRGFFSGKKYAITYQPHNADLCCGLKIVGDCALHIYGTLVTLGIYVCLKVLDKLYVQGVSLLDDVASLIFPIAYFLLTPLVFHLTISSSNYFLTGEKRKFLKSAERLYLNQVKLIGDVTIENGGIDTVQKTASLAEGVDLLRKKIPIWPFRFTFSPAITMMAPVLSLALSLGMVFVKNAVAIWKAAYLLNVASG